jgi:tRNA(Ser,Leu) C12 N-acetylase TAN1
MENFHGFVISSRRYEEKEAAKEIHYILEMVLEYEDVEVRPIYKLIGLSIAHFHQDPIKTLIKIEEKMVEDPDLFRYVLKIVPIQYKLETDLSKIGDLADRFESELDKDDNWRLLLRRRATNISHDEIVEAAAKEIDKVIVDLEDPEYIIRIELMEV